MTIEPGDKILALWPQLNFHSAKPERKHGSSAAPLCPVALALSVGLDLQLITTSVSAVFRDGGGGLLDIIEKYLESFSKLRCRGEAESGSAAADDDDVGGSDHSELSFCSATLTGRKISLCCYR